MKKKQKIFVLGFLTVVTSALGGCGAKNVSHVSSAGVAGAQAAATNNTPTALQGYWTNCTSGVLTSYDFYGNGYFTEVDQYSSSDCSDAQAASLGTPTFGTFVVSSAQESMGTAQPITLMPSAVGGTQSVAGYFSVLGTNTLILQLGSGPSMGFTIQGAYNGISTEN